MLCMLCISCSALAQTCTIQLSGHVEDTDSKEKLFAATVFVKELNKQIVTDDKGDFTFYNVCEGVYTLQISHVNCATVQQIIMVKKTMHIDVYLPHQKNTLKEVVQISVAKIANTGFKSDVSSKALAQAQGLSISQALAKINGVSLLQTGTNIAKPIIHGLHSNRILTINNGVRQEGQQWGNEHAPEIDLFIADRLTVIKGVDELKYGSDAIGGVILVETKPLRKKPGYDAEINTGYFTNNRQYIASAVFEQQLKKYPTFNYRIQGTLKKSANAATPNYRLNNTATAEQNFSATIGFKKEKINAELFYSYFKTKAGIFSGSHIGNLTDLLHAIAANTPSNAYIGQNSYQIKRPYQDVAHHLFKAKTFFFIHKSKFNVLLSGQYNQRKEFDIVRNAANTSPQIKLDILTLAQDISWEHAKQYNFTGTIGLSSMEQKNTYSGRYFIPNYTSNSIGFYAIEKWNNNKWYIQAGIRYDDKKINTNRLKYNGAIIDYSFKFSTFAAAANTNYHFNSNLQSNISISLASRAPYVNELLSDGIHHGTATYELGDIYLKPEKAVNIATGITYTSPNRKLSFQFNVYRNSIKDFIYQQPMPDSPVLTIAGAFPKIVYNQNNALLQGIDASIHWQMASRFLLESKYTMLRATNTNTNDWLIWMPADRITNELTYTFMAHKNFHDSYISAEVQHVLYQSRVPSNKYGKQDYKDAPDGYMLINIYAATTINIAKIPITIGFGVTNTLNAVYRDYLNSFRYFTDEMGRNVSLKLKIQLSHQIKNEKNEKK